MEINITNWNQLKSKIKELIYNSKNLDIDKIQERFSELISYHIILNI